MSDTLKEGIELHLSRSLRTLTALSFSIKNIVYKELFLKEVDLMFANFIYARSNVAQYSKGINKVIENIDKLNILLKVLSDLQMIDKTTPLLLQRDLLEIRKLLILSKYQPEDTGDKKKTTIHSAFPKSPVKNKPKRQKLQSNRELNKTEEKIVDIIRQSDGGIQMNGIAGKIKNLSNRTIKRALSQLLQQKFIHKKLDGRKAIYQVVTTDNSTGI